MRCAVVARTLIDPPSAFSPISELRAFLKQWESDPDKDLPEVQTAVARVKRSLELRLRAEESMKTKAG